MKEAVILCSEDAIMLKQAIAKKLYEEGMEQSKISDLLRITQPMVSKYISADIKIEDKIKKYAEKIIEKKRPIEFCTCVILSDKVEGEYYIAEKNELITDEKQRVIDNMNEAFSLLKGKNAAGIMPKVKMNMVMCTKNAKHRDDIASFSHGLIVIDNKFSSVTGIRFGKSQHLAGLLLDIRKELHDINAMMNIRLIDKFGKLKTALLTRDFRLKTKEKNIDILLHKGDFGIEPCAYILGKDAVDVAKKVARLGGG